MKKIIAFAGSNSSTSINKQLVTYAAGQFSDFDTEILDLNDYDLPIYIMDIEKATGIPQPAKDFLNKIHSSDGILLSLAEHNGAYSAVFKNLFDWMSRIDGKLWHDIPMLLMAASPGGRGGRSVLDIASDRFPRMGAQIVAEFSLPAFGDNFKEGVIVNPDLDGSLKEAINSLINQINS